MELANDPDGVVLDEVAPVERALMALAVETVLLVVATVLFAPPSALFRLGDRAIRSCAARWSSGFGPLPGFAPVTVAGASAVAGAVADVGAGGTDNMDAVADGADAMDGEEV